LLTWKPTPENEENSKELKKTAANLRRKRQPEEWQWSCGRNKHIDVGSRVFLLRQGKYKPGIVASGWVTEQSKEDERWDDSKRKTCYVWVESESEEMVDPFPEGVLPRAKLMGSILSHALLNSRIDGVTVPLEYSEKLEWEWRKHLKRPINTSRLVINGISAWEGEPTEYRCYRRKRDQQLRRSALDGSKDVCAVCNVDYSKVLDGKGVRALQAHHKKQLSQMDAPRLNTVADLAIVCANCHAFIHMDPKKSLTIAMLRSKLRRPL
jgi:hypothetical protein